MKQHIYKVFKDFYDSPYDVKLNAIGKTTIAKGLKEEIENVYPGIKDLNLSEKQLLDFLDPLNKSLQRQAGQQTSTVNNLAPVVGTAMGAKVSPVTWSISAGKAASSDAFKSRLAVLLNMLKTKSPSEVRKWIAGQTRNAFIGASNYENNNELSN